MTLIKRQGVSFVTFDDQSAELWGAYVGNWTHYNNVQGFNNNTVTATPTPGASLSFSFSGNQGWLYGGLLNITSSDGQIISYPTADYKVDGFSAGTQKPWLDSTGAVVYFQTPVLADGTHKIDINVTVANNTNPYIIDFFLISPTAGGSNSGVQTSRSTPTPTVPIHVTQGSTTPVGAIVGGVVGGIAGIALLLLAAWYFLFRKKRGGQAYYFDKPRPEDMLAAEDNHVEPFGAGPTTPAASSPGFNGPGRMSTYSDISSNQPLNPRNTLISSPPSHYSQSGPSQSGPSEGGGTYVSGDSAQPRTGKHALIAQQHQNVQPPVQFEDSGIRFNEGDHEVGPSQLPAEVPPSYTAS